MNKIYLKQNEIKELRYKLWLRNNKECPILKVPIEFNKTTLDHIHKLKSEETSITKGSIRDAIDFRANALEGKITNSFRRYFGADESKHPITLPDFLRNLADYLEKGAYIDENKYFIHPNEKPREPKLMKSSYNRLHKLYKESDKKAKFPEYTGNLTKKLKKLFEDFKLEYKTY